METTTYTLVKAGNALDNAAKKVVDRWSGGDLAGAVRELDAARREWANTVATARDYTVVLLYPGYLCDDYGGPQSYLAHVQAASSAEMAATLARQQAAEECGDTIHDPNDFEVLAVFAGIHDDRNRA